MIILCVLHFCVGFTELATKLEANDVLRYLKHSNWSNLERAMNQAVLIAWEKEEKIKK